MKFLLPLILIALAACQSKNEEKNELRLTLASEVSTIDPAICYDQVCQQVVANSYETLYEYEYLKRPYQLRPLLATDMPESSDNGRKITLRIKQNVPYHAHSSIAAGRTVKAQDIVMAIKRQAFAPTRGQGWWLFEHRVVGLDEWRAKVGTDLEAMFKEPVAGLTTPDDHTLVIQLTKSFPQLQFAFAMTFTSPIPEETVRALKNDLTREGVGTGPFVIKDYQPNSQIVLEKFPGYAVSTFPTMGDRQANENDFLNDSGKALPFLDRIVKIGRAHV